MSSSNGNPQGTRTVPSSGLSVLPMIGSHGGGTGALSSAPTAVKPSPAPGIPQQANSAVIYLDDVKREFIDQPDIYNEFLAVMKEFKSGGLDTVGVRTRVMELFKGHKKILLGFNAFLPPNCAITELDMEESYNRTSHAISSSAVISTSASNPSVLSQRFVVQSSGQRNAPSLPPPPSSVMGIAYPGMPIGMDYGAHFSNDTSISSFRGNIPSSGVTQQVTQQPLHYGQFGPSNGPTLPISGPRSSTPGLTSHMVPPTSPPGMGQQSSNVQTNRGLSSRGGPSLMSGYVPTSSIAANSGSLWPPMGAASMMQGPPMSAHFPGSLQQQTQFGAPMVYQNQQGSYSSQGPSMSSFHPTNLQGHIISHHHQQQHQKQQQQQQDSRALSSKQMSAEQTNPEFTKAVDFVRRVRARFSNRPKVYEEFLETLRGGSADQLSKLSPEEVNIYCSYGTCVV
jgi:histone deacetylase complex regulatory component SIN3